MDKKNSYLIYSLAPLVFRAGRPFGSQMSAQDINFPPPATGAGLMRALSIAQQHIAPMAEHLVDKSIADLLLNEHYQQILAIKSYGVYLVRYANEEDLTVLLPKPANSLYLEDDSGQIKLIRLRPKPLMEGCGCDLPEHLMPVQMEDGTLKGKPKSGVNFWALEDIYKWQNGEALDYQTVAKNGLHHIPTDIRTHNAIDDDSLAVQEGQLFQTVSYDLNYVAKNSQYISERGFEERRLGFVVVSQQALSADLVSFGGERRLSAISPIKTDIIQKPSQTLLDKINAAKGFALMMMTPCVFGQGYLPSWIDGQTMQGVLPNSDIKLQLKAAALPSWQAVSGWDSIIWRPKAMRKAIPAGSVYWFGLLDELNLASLERLMMPLADNEYDQNDGFGVAMVTPWQG